jgi:hypothetical protein
MIAGRVRRIREVVALAMLAAPTVAAAQVTPTSPPHPAFPWGLGIATPHGQLLRYVYVPPRPVVLEYASYAVPAAPESPPLLAEQALPGAGGGATLEGEAPPDVARESRPAGPWIVRQQVTEPGYYVRETTVGFHYPERWVIEQTAPGAYRWRVLPAQFVSKY